MEAKGKMMDSKSHLILHRTPREMLKAGITVITKGEGTRVFDQDGKGYLDLVSGVTRPVHVGYGRKEIAQAVYDQICELSYFTPMQFSNMPAMRLAEALANRCNLKDAIRHGTVCRISRQEHPEDSVS